MDIKLLFLSQPRALKPGERRSYTVLKMAKRLRQKAAIDSSNFLIAVRRKHSKHISSYILFSCEKLRESTPGMPYIEKTKKISEMWRDLPVMRRKVYIEAAKEKRLRG